MNIFKQVLLLGFLLCSMCNSAHGSSESFENTNDEISEETVQANIQAELNLVVGNLLEQGLTVASILAQQEQQATLISNLMAQLQNQQMMFEQASTEQEMAIEQLEAQLLEQAELNANISTQLQNQETSFEQLLNATEQASIEQEMAFEQLEMQLQEQAELIANNTVSTITVWGSSQCPNTAEEVRA